MFSSILAFALCGLSSAATQGVAPAPLERPWTVTISPLWLLPLGMPEVGVQYRVSPELGVAAELGSTLGISKTGYQIGSGQLRVYPQGARTHALQLGVDVQWIRIDRSQEGLGTRQHLVAGPIIGYRWQQASGFTLDSYGGVGIGRGKRAGKAGISSCSGCCWG